MLYYKERKKEMIREHSFVKVVMFGGHLFISVLELVYIFIVRFFLLRIVFVNSAICILIQILNFAAPLIRKARLFQYTIYNIEHWCFVCSNCAASNKQFTVILN